MLSYSNPRSNPSEEVDLGNPDSAPTPSLTQRHSRNNNCAKSSLPAQTESSAPPSPSPPTTPPIPHVPSAEALLRLEAAAAEFSRCFPAGRWRIIETSTEGLLCGWHAVMLSMWAQWPTLPQPSRDDLIAIFQRQSVEFALVFGMENTDNFSVDQVAAVLYAWGRERGLNLRLGYLEDGATPLLVSHPHEDEDVRVVWVHNDGNWDGGIGHFSGIMSWGEEEGRESEGEELQGGEESGIVDTSEETQIDPQACEKPVVDVEAWKERCIRLLERMDNGEDIFKMKTEETKD